MGEPKGPLYPDPGVNPDPDPDYGGPGFELHSSSSPSAEEKEEEEENTDPNKKSARATLLGAAQRKARIALEKAVKRFGRINFTSAEDLADFDLHSLIIRVVTRYRINKIPGRNPRDLKLDQSRKAMLNYGDPFAIYMPCYEQYINEVTTDRAKYKDKDKGPITNEQLEQAFAVLAREAPIDATGKMLTSNWDTNKALKEIHPQMSDYLYQVMKMQYGRHDLSIAGTLASFSDSHSFWAALDRKAVFPSFYGPNAHSYLHAEMMATIKRTIFYDGIRVDTSEKNVLKQYHNDKLLFTAKSQEIDKDTEKFKLHLTINPDLSDEEFAKAIGNALIFVAQYTQHSSINTCPITRFSKNPVHNIIMVLKAAGELHMNVPQDLLDKVDMESLLDSHFAGDTAKIKEMSDLWEISKTLAQLVYPNFVSGKPHLHPQAQGILDQLRNDKRFKEDYADLLQVGPPGKKLTLKDLTAIQKNIMQRITKPEPSAGPSAAAGPNAAVELRTGPRPGSTGS